MTARDRSPVPKKDALDWRSINLSKRGGVCLRRNTLLTIIMDVRKKTLRTPKKFLRRAVRSHPGWDNGGVREGNPEGGWVRKGGGKEIQICIDPRGKNKKLFLLKEALSVKGPCVSEYH